MSVSLNVIVPEDGSCKEAMVFIKVDFPAPFGPNKPNIPLVIFNETSFNAHTPLGYVFDKF
jgi:hypothetical protein